MKQVLTITLLFVVLSCGQNNRANRSDLLTSSIWTIEKGSVLGDFADKYKFLTDGTCLITTGESEVFGLWIWTEDDEIYIKPEGVVQNGQKIKAAHSYGGFYIRIVELTDKTFRTLERFEADNWGSGLVKERQYASLSL